MEYVRYPGFNLEFNDIKVFVALKRIGVDMIGRPFGYLRGWTEEHHIRHFWAIATLKLLPQDKLTEMWIDARQFYGQHHLSSDAEKVLKEISTEGITEATLCQEPEMVPAP